MQRLVMGLFDSLAAANAAVDDLVAKGIPRERMHLTTASHVPAPEPEAQTEEDGVFRRLLVQLGIVPAHSRRRVFPEAERRIFSEGLRRGGVLVAATVETDRHLDEAEDAFERFGAIDIDERADEWRATGWQTPEKPRTGEPVAPEVAQLAQNIGAIPESTPRRRTRVFTRNDSGEPGGPAAESKPAAATPPASVPNPVERTEATRRATTQPSRSEPGGIDADFRMHFGKVYGSSGREYDYYISAYRLGAELAQRERCDWESAQPQAKAEWEQRESQKPWDTVVDAVHFGFERARTGSATIPIPSEPPLRDSSGAGAGEPVIPPPTAERPM